MGTTMDKDKVIYGQGHGVPLNQINWNALQQAIVAEVGLERVTGLADAKNAVTAAQRNPALQSPYVKVGMAGNDLVLRIKDKRTLKDKEIDTVLIKGYKAKLQDYRRKLEAVKNAGMQQADPALLKKMIDTISQCLEGELPNPTSIGEAKKAVAERDFGLAFAKVGGLSKMIRNAKSHLRKLDVFAEEVCKTNHWDIRHVDLKKLTKKYQGVVAVVEKTEKLLQKLELEVAEMEREVSAIPALRRCRKRTWPRCFSLSMAKAWTWSARPSGPSSISKTNSNPCWRIWRSASRSIATRPTRPWTV
jgi:hypothetical protein